MDGTWGYLQNCTPVCKNLGNLRKAAVSLQKTVKTTYLDSTVSKLLHILYFVKEKQIGNGTLKFLQDDPGMVQKN